MVSTIRANPTLISMMDQNDIEFLFIKNPIAITNMAITTFLER